VVTHRIAGHDAEDLVIADVDGVLPPELREDLERHLATCGECRMRRSQHMTLQRRLAAPAADASSVMAARERVRARLEPVLRSPPAASPVARLGRVLVALAAVVTIVVGIGWSQQYRIGVAQGTLPVLYREEVTRTEFRNELVSAELIVQQRHSEGSTGLRVVAQVDVGLRSDALPATIEVHGRPSGSHIVEVLGRSANLQTVREATGLTRTNYIAPLPPTARGEVRTYEVWLFLETARGIFESQRLLVEIVGRPEGERARVLPD
jgi:hypothetical protein